MSAAGTAAETEQGTTEGTVYDLGYTPHEGARLGRTAAIRAMLIDGTRRSLGLRRKPWTKVLPWCLVASAIVPAGWFVALTFFVVGFDVEDLGPFASPYEFFGIIVRLGAYLDRVHDAENGGDRADPKVKRRHSNHR